MHSVPAFPHQYRKEKIMNIIEIIINEIQTDSSDTDKESEYLEAYYEKTTREQREAINYTLIALCGWTFEGLWKKSREED